MNQEPATTTPTMRAITISREYGSGGGEIATRLARRLGWHLVDHELVVQVARELRVTEAEATVLDEHAETLASQVLRNMQWVGQIGPWVSELDLPDQPVDAKQYQAAIQRVVMAAVETGPVVIVGRGAQVLLAGHRDVLHARVVAPVALRVAYVARREGLDEPTAQARIQLKDQDRLTYLRTYYHQQADDPHLYDLVLNTGVLSLDDAVDLLCLALERKGKRLTLPVGTLGPGAGLTPYAGPPGDLRPPQRDPPEPTPTSSPAVPE